MAHLAQNGYSRLDSLARDASAATAQLSTTLTIQNDEYRSLRQCEMCLFSRYPRRCSVGQETRLTLGKLLQDHEVYVHNERTQTLLRKVELAQAVVSQLAGGGVEAYSRYSLKCSFLAYVLIRWFREGLVRFGWRNRA